MDWSATNRVDTYYFEMVDPHDLSASRGELTGVVPAKCSLTWGYYTDLQAKGTLSLQDGNYLANSLVRIWQTSTLGTDILTRELGTYFVDTSSATYKWGRWSGEMDLFSPLLIFDDDLLGGDYALGAGTMAAQWFADVATGAGATPHIYPHLQDVAFGSPAVFKFADKSRVLLQHAADYLNCRIGVDTHGRITLEPYQAPSRKTVAYEIPTGEMSVTLAGVSRSETRDAAINRVVAKYQKDDITLYAHADVPPQYFSSFERCGRRKTKPYEINDLQPATSARLQEVADHYLAINTSAPTKYEADMYCLPFRCGDVVRFDYQDSSAGGISIDGLVQQIDMVLKPGARMHVVLDEVRRHS